MKKIIIVLAITIALLVGAIYLTELRWGEVVGSGTVYTKQELLQATYPQKAVDVTHYYKIKHNLGYKPKVTMTLEVDGSNKGVDIPYSSSVTNRDDAVTTAEDITYTVSNDLVVITHRLRYNGGSGRVIELSKHKLNYTLTRTIF